VHRGRQYRQVLPRAITPDVTINGAPTRLRLDVLFIYEDVPVIDPTALSDVATVLLDQGTIRWDGDVHNAPRPITFVVKQSFQNHAPGYDTRIDLRDSTGHHLVADFHHDFGEPAWGLTTFPFYTFGHMVSQSATGSFGVLLDATGFPIHYHEEP